MRAGKSSLHASRVHTFRCRVGLAVSRQQRSFSQICAMAHESNADMKKKGGQQRSQKRTEATTTGGIITRGKENGNGEQT